MATIDDLNTAVEALKVQDQLVVDGIASLKSKIQELTDIINSTPNVDAQIAAAVQAINEEIEKLKNSI